MSDFEIKNEYVKLLLKLSFFSGLLGFICLTIWDSSQIKVFLILCIVFAIIYVIVFLALVIWVVARVVSAILGTEDD